MRLKPSRSFSRSVSKRSRAPGISVRQLLLFLLIVSGVTAPLHAENGGPHVTLAVRTSRVLQDHLLLDIELSDYDPSPVLDALHDGLRSEIEFVARVYRPRRGIFRILGDRRLSEHGFRYEAYWDIFERRYVLVSEGATERFANQEDFLRAFFAVSRLRVPLDEISDNLSEEDIAVAAQARLTPVKLVPALGLLTFVLRDDVLATEWVRCEIDTVEDLSAINGGGLLCEIDGQHTPR